MAILGDSGVGKSTLIDLITGLIKPDEGKILIDDKETEIFFSNLRDKIGIVTQKLYLFDFEELHIGAPIYFQLGQG